MPGPPKDVPASELFLKLTEAPRPTEVVDFPRKDRNGKPVAQIRVQVLKMEEHDMARIKAHEALKRRRFDSDDLKSVTMSEVAGDAVAKELLAMACLTVESASRDDDAPLYGRIFRDARDLDQLTADEIAILFTLYLQVQHKYGPYEKIVQDDADLEAWLKRLQEGGSEFPLLQLPSPQLVELASSLAGKTFSLCRILASQWESLPTTLASDLESCFSGIRSFGEPADDSSETGSESLPDPLGLPGDEPISMQAAAEMARRMKT